MIQDYNYLEVDVLILGAGAAGLTTALSLPEKIQVAIVSKDNSGGSTRWAQGGVAAAIDHHDSIQNHINDTIVAGDGLCDQNTVTAVVADGKDSIRWLVEQGVEFSRQQNTNEFHLAKEGGHSHRRILHAADATGKAIQNALEVAAAKRENLSFINSMTAIDVFVDKESQHKNVTGAYCFNELTNKILTINAKCVVIATGGASKVYQFSSNPDGSTGDGIAIAWRAGCRVSNLEFNQFHPTCLFHRDAKSFLISEALRGEGGRLILPDGNQFMINHDKREELAPRDIVARAIDFEMKRLGINNVFLDMSHHSPQFIQSHFPNINNRLLKLGINMAVDPIPVVPAAHYTCGGVVVADSGETDIQGLYAIGEVSYTGLHGANRMASNSLLECIVYGRSVAKHILINYAGKNISKNRIPLWDSSQVRESDENITIAHNWTELRHVMWDYVGIMRSNRRLNRALKRITLLKKEVREFYWDYNLSRPLIELRNLTLVADLIVRSALKRRESRGLHFNIDYPKKLRKAQPTVLQPK